MSSQGRYARLGAWPDRLPRGTARGNGARSPARFWACIADAGESAHVHAGVWSRLVVRSVLFGGHPWSALEGSRPAADKECSPRRSLMTGVKIPSLAVRARVRNPRRLATQARSASEEIADPDVGPDDSGRPLVVPAPSSIGLEACVLQASPGEVSSRTMHKRVICASPDAR